MKLNIKDLTDFQKFSIIRSLMKWEKENKIKLCLKGEPLDVKFMLNGKELDFLHMFTDIEKNMDEYIENKAREILEDKFFDFETEVTDALEETLNDVKLKMFKEMKNMNKVLKLEEFGCYFRIVEGFLQCSPMLIDGTNEENWSDVSDFYKKETKAVNDYYGTNYDWNVEED